MLRTAELSPELAAALEEERESGEQLLWVSQSQPVIVSKGSNRGVETTMGVFFLCLGSYFAKLGFDMLPNAVGIPWLFMILGILIALSGLCSVFLSPKIQPILKQTEYAITTKRVLIIELIGTHREVRSFVPRDANLLKRIERQDGGGNLTLGAIGTTATGNAQNISLLNVADVHGVERLVRETFFAGETRGG